MQRLVLWDVDGTLVRGGVGAREALGEAVGAVLGRPVEADGIVMSGKTDPQILAEIVAREAVDDHAGVVAAALDRLPGVFAGFAGRYAATGRALPGVPSILQRLQERGDVLQTLLTGNVRANGIAKVAAFDLDRWLDPDAGAYGSDHGMRDELVPIALQRAAERAGRDWDPDDVWVVGDTPRDLACARAGGVRCLLVATGRYPVAELDGLGADAVFADLSDTDAVEALLAG